MGQHKHNPRVELARQGKLPSKEEEWRAAHPRKTMRMSKNAASLLAVMAALNLGGYSDNRKGRK